MMISQLRFLLAQTGTQAYAADDAAGSAGGFRRDGAFDWQMDDHGASDSSDARW